MLVSTMDGYLTAMDAATGVEEWSVSTGLSLVSSSISKFEVSYLFMRHIYMHLFPHDGCNSGLF